MSLEGGKAALLESLEWFLDHMKVERGASTHTIAAYQNDLSQAIDFFAKRGLRDWKALGPVDLVAYEASLGPGIARTTAQRRLSALRSLLKFLKRNHQGPAVDLPSTGGFRKAKTLPKALSREQMEALLQTPDLTKPTGLRDRALMELVYGAGLRVTEAVELSLSNLALEERTVRVTGKRGKTRQVPLPEGTVNWLGKYLDEARPVLQKKPTGTFLISDTGRTMLRQTAYDLMERYSRLAGLVGVSPHTLRHTYAVHLIKGGADLRAVQELLGHESVATTQVYTQLDLDEVRQKYNRSHPRG
ncbi:tyrosine-type recombinase/integrase [Fimbriimonas ginsengisoli]|uniref:Tyrosine recombinase XerD n=1 Tax=Fimbriimonas ginsengisoli Gsoil 348 TaxID=661478 RepID=A0A068NWY9_FIMGI|nr:tyrosine-type recombinase/integrase [Fimbriimonas ginsengisoli]AIE87882.1 tyrosine recombinase XerD [Fimbriimonas ginsengisoli Gsoil 348]